MKNIPEKIYLQHGLSDSELNGVDFNYINNHGNISWCKDQIEQNDICYVLESQNKELRDDLNQIEHSESCMCKMCAPGFQEMKNKEKEK